MTPYCIMSFFAFEHLRLPALVINSGRDKSSTVYVTHVGSQPPLELTNLADFVRRGDLLPGSMYVTIPYVVFQEQHPHLLSIRNDFHAFTSKGLSYVLSRLRKLASATVSIRAAAYLSCRCFCSGIRSFSYFNLMYSLISRCGDFRCTIPKRLAPNRISLRSNQQVRFQLKH